MSQRRAQIIRQQRKKNGGKVYRFNRAKPKNNNKPKNNKPKNNSKNNNRNNNRSKGGFPKNNRDGDKYPTHHHRDSDKDCLHDSGAFSPCRTCHKQQQYAQRLAANETEVATTPESTTEVELDF
jgi:hypothetical protein